MWNQVGRLLLVIVIINITVRVNTVDAVTHSGLSTETGDSGRLVNDFDERNDGKTSGNRSYKDKSERVHGQPIASESFGSVGKATGVFHTSGRSGHWKNSAGYSKGVRSPHESPGRNEHNVETRHAGHQTKLNRAHLGERNVFDLTSEGRNLHKDKRVSGSARKVATLHHQRVSSWKGSRNQFEFRSDTDEAKGVSLKDTLEDSSKHRKGAYSPQYSGNTVKKGDKAEGVSLKDRLEDSSEHRKRAHSLQYSGNTMKKGGKAKDDSLEETSKNSSAHELRGARSAQHTPNTQNAGDKAKVASLDETSTNSSENEFRNAHAAQYTRNAPKAGVKAVDDSSEETSKTSSSTHDLRKTRPPQHIRNTPRGRDRAKEASLEETSKNSSSTHELRKTHSQHISNARDKAKETSKNSSTHELRTIRPSQHTGSPPKATNKAMGASLQETSKNSSTHELRKARSPQYALASLNRGLGLSPLGLQYQPHVSPLGYRTSPALQTLAAQYRGLIPTTNGLPYNLQLARLLGLLQHRAQIPGATAGLGPNNAGVGGVTADVHVYKPPGRLKYNSIPSTPNVLGQLGVPLLALNPFNSIAGTSAPSFGEASEDTMEDLG